MTSADAFVGWALDVEIALGPRALHLELRTESRTVAIVGPSGSGKSTLLRILAGVDRRAKGTVEVGGTVWLDSGGGVSVPPWERRVGWVPQEVLLFPHLTVRENLSYAGASDTEVGETAALLEVDHILDRRPRHLSGGERQRVALGRALRSSPRLLLLDEPFSALDRPLREKLAGLVRRWADDQGIPLVLVSHDERDIDVLADEHWHLSGGALRLSREGPPPESYSPA
jgi:molybdate transport system ATP-binding protein